jgi:hypothetical protein
MCNPRRQRITLRIFGFARRYLSPLPARMAVSGKLRCSTETKSIGRYGPFGTSCTSPGNYAQPAASEWEGAG